jgi:dCTP deaminase
LYKAAPIKDMVPDKRREHGVSYGLGEAGYDIRLKQHVYLSTSKRFTLASAIEEFQMPEHLVGVVHDKSTWARRGLSVFNTVIEPGWRGFLTLELVYHGDWSIDIPAGAGIAQVLFHELHEPRAYDGKYQGQGDHPVEARHG